jgi:membrane associated rhomboid family serine protease
MSPLAPRAPRARELILGRLRIPWVIAGLIIASAVISIAGAIGARNQAGWIAEGSLLSVAEVWRGQLWRLVTWSLCEFSPLGLLFACLTIYWFGSDLARRWGDGRFLGFYFGVAAAAAAFTSILALLWTALQGAVYAGSWAVLDATIVAWGLLYPAREIRLYGVLRLTGRHLVWLTFGLTLLFALFYGPAAFVPHFAAELLVFIWLGPLFGALARRRQAALQARAKNFDLQRWIDNDRGR